MSAGAAVSSGSLDRHNWHNLLPVLRFNRTDEEATGKVLNVNLHNLPTGLYIPVDHCIGPALMLVLSVYPAGHKFAGVTADQNRLGLQPDNRRMAPWADDGNARTYFTDTAGARAMVAVCKMGRVKFHGVQSIVCILSPVNREKDIIFYSQSVGVSFD